MWPFKKKEKISFKELVKTYEPAPCGEQERHYRWRDVQGMPCPICAGIQRRKEERKKDEHLADLIASRVVERLQLLQNAATPQVLDSKDNSPLPNP